MAAVRDTLVAALPNFLNTMSATVTASKSTQREIDLAAAYDDVIKRNAKVPSCAVLPDELAGKITDDDINLFTSGSCHVLAREISELIGWPIHCYATDKDPCHHAFVVDRK